MAHANAMQVWPTTTVSAQSVPLELSSVLKPIPASSFVDKIQSTTVQQEHVSVLQAMVSKTVNAKSAPLTTSSAMDIVWPAQLTQFWTQQLTLVIAWQDSLLT